MLLKITSEILLIGEQDGEIEQLIKQKFSQVFAKSTQPVRAYLVRVQYPHNHSIGVALCIRTTKEDTHLVEQCAQQFSTVFAANQHLDILFINDEQEQTIGTQCDPFYSNFND